MTNLRFFFASGSSFARPSFERSLCSCFRCGFFRINGESVVPYTLRDGVKFVPLFYFEGETEHLKLKSDQVNGWDLAYLKFCCKVQGIRNELFSSETCR